MVKEPEEIQKFDLCIIIDLWEPIFGEMPHFDFYRDLKFRDYLIEKFLTTASLPSDVIVTSTRGKLDCLLKTVLDKGHNASKILHTHSNLLDYKDLADLKIAPPGSKVLIIGQHTFSCVVYSTLGIKNALTAKHRVFVDTMFLNPQINLHVEREAVIENMSHVWTEQGLTYKKTKRLEGTPFHNLLEMSFAMTWLNPDKLGNKS